MELIDTYYLDMWNAHKRKRHLGQLGEVFEKQIEYSFFTPGMWAPLAYPVASRLRTFLASKRSFNNATEAQRQLRAMGDTLASASLPP